MEDLGDWEEDVGEERGREGLFRIGDRQKDVVDGPEVAQGLRYRPGGEKGRGEELDANGFELGHRMFSVSMPH